uniref:Putative transcription elongation factor n=1 Tax=Trypanosoma congolense (strain IL3000) TaxID=1068625 RepID=G0V0C4_TRYCI|nr:putative transcription elongation factor [Trypanosoma congolense IL3000]
MSETSDVKKLALKRPRSEDPTEEQSPALHKEGAPTSSKLIQGRQGDARLIKWKTMLCRVLTQGRKVEDEERVSGVAQRVVEAIPGGRSESADTFRVLLVHMGDAKNEKLRESIIEGVLSVETLVRMKESELLNPEERMKQEAAFLERCKDTDLSEIRKATSTTSTLFPCPSCKARNCSWSQKQTRSADEPMTVFCICNVCDHKWRRY